MSLMLCVGPQAFSQGLAWMNMLANYVPESGLFIGIQETFDGSRPCDMCCQIEASQQESLSETRIEQEQRIPFVALKPHFHIACLASDVSNCIGSQCTSFRSQHVCDIDNPPPIC